MKPIQPSTLKPSSMKTTVHVLKAIVGGFLVSTIGIATWTADIAIFKLAPWSIVLMLVPLWVYWKFFSGRSWPAWNSNPRQMNFRLSKMSGQTWKFGLVAAMLFVVMVQSGFVITFRLIELPDSFSSQYKIIEILPVSVAWLAIVMSSLVAGICEEVGFRGYMQVPLERRFGPAVAIAGVSLIFVLIHLDRSWAVPVLPIIFLASVLLGVLAYKTKSLIPGIVGHTVLDVFDYSLWWTRLMGKFEYQTVFNSGIDAHFIIWVFIFLASLVIFIWTMLQLNTQSLAPATNDRNH